MFGWSFPRRYMSGTCGRLQNGNWLDVLKYPERAMQQVDRCLQPLLA